MTGKTEVGSRELKVKSRKLKEDGTGRTVEKLKLETGDAEREGADARHGVRS